MIDLMIKLDCNIPQLRIKAILNNSRNEILFDTLDQNKDPHVIQIPSGEVHFNELVEVSLKKMIREKIGLEIEPLAILGIYSAPNLILEQHFVTMVFVCLITDFHGAGSIFSRSTYKWIDSKRVDSMNLKEEDKKIFTDYMNWRVHKSTYWTSKIV